MNLLSFLVVPASESDISLVFYISIGAVVLLIAVLALLAAQKKIQDTRMLANASIAIAAAYALSFFKVEMAFGGSITPASFVPLILFSFAYGPSRGLFVGIVYSVLQFIQQPWFLHPIQLILDYPLAFASIALAGVFKGKFKSTMSQVLLGTVCVGAARLLMHTFAGMYFWEQGKVIADITTNNAFIYSLIYNLMYIPLDIVICLAALFYLVKSRAFDTLIGNMRPKQQ